MERMHSSTAYPVCVQDELRGFIKYQNPNAPWNRGRPAAGSNAGGSDPSGAAGAGALAAGTDE